ncbi:MAG: CapA family protein [Acidimicrobiia bacterium]
MSGLISRFVFLVVAAAMCGATAFDSPPSTDAAPQLESPPPVTVATTTSTTMPPTVATAPSTTSTVPAGAEAEAPPIEVPDQLEATVVFGGDVLIHSTLRSHAALGGNVYDFRPMFEAIRPALLTADLAICHLEVPLTSSNTDLSTYPRFNAPHEVATAIAYAGFDGCSTASNHSADEGAAGMIDTLDILDRAGLSHAGTARSPEEAGSATFYQTGGPTVAHIAGTYWLNGLSTPEGQDWMAQRLDVDQILGMADSAREAGADLVVVSVHCCTEYRSEPTPEQVEIFDRLIRSPSVDLVVGHHSHVVGPIDTVDGEFLVYGLGNLLSGQLHRTDSREAYLAFVRAEWANGRWAFTAVEAMPVFVESGSYQIVPVGPDTASYARTMAILNSRDVTVAQRTVDGAAESG